MAAVKGSLGVVGASGFIGMELARQASRVGWRVVGFSRRPQPAGDPVAEWRRWDDAPDLSGLKVVANLAGKPVDCRWTESNQRAMRDSRIGVTEAIVGAIRARAAGERPAVLLNGSAVGIYGDRGDERLSDSATAGSGFLAGLCRDWEAAADPAAELGVRVLKWRTGVVLGEGGAAWTKMRRAFALGLGGRFGDGRQWLPWIHVGDLVAGMLHALDSRLSGPVNGTAPEPERNAEFTRRLAAALHRPAVLHAPGWALRLGLGGFASALLGSQRAIPTALLADGFRFRYPTFEAALADLV